MPATLPHLARPLDVLRHERRVFILATKLATDVSFETDALVLIRCEALDLTVWGQSLAEAEEAFAFSFDALYQNYYLAADAELAPDAQRIKAILHQLVREVVQL